MRLEAPLGGTVSIGVGGGSAPEGFFLEEEVGPGYFGAPELLRLLGGAKKETEKRQDLFTGARYWMRLVED